MSAHRFYLRSALLGAQGDVVTLPLSDADLHHAVGVLRVRPDEVIEVVDPDGSAWASVCVVSAEKDAVTARVLERHVEARRGAAVTLIQGVAKGEKMDGIVRQCTEIGVAEIVPVLTERSVVRLAEDKRHARGERWRRIAKSAAEQSHASYLPKVHDPISLRGATDLLGEYDAVLVLWEDAPPGGMEAVLRPLRGPVEARVALIVGPEGGLSAEEVDALRDVGANVVGLGTSILRTETAAVVAVTLAAYLLGGLGAPDA